MAKKPKPPGPCTYCQTVGPLTDDHVPPKLLFPKPRPSNLVTVPACFPCNNGASLDDAYFRLNISLRENAGEHPEAEQIWKAALKDLSRDEAAGLRELFFDDMRRGYAKTGNPRAYSPDTKRLLRVMSRTAKGLYFAHTGVAIPRNTMAFALSDERVAASPQADFRAQVGNVSAALRAAPIKIGGAFEYAYKLFSEEPYASVWALRFFDDSEFIVMTGNPGRYRTSLREATFPPPTGGYERKKPFPRRPPGRPKPARRK